MNADGSGVTRLTENDAVDVVPYLVARRPAHRVRLHPRRELGDLRDERRRLRRHPPHRQRRLGLVLPPGRPMAGASRSTPRDGNREIYVMNADGSGVTRLTYNSAQDGTPAWSPDGRRIAFASGPRGKWEIYVMDASGVTRLTDNDAHDGTPAGRPTAGASRSPPSATEMRST